MLVWLRYETGHFLWMIGLVGISAGALALRLVIRPGHDASYGPRGWEHLLALTSAIGLGIFMLFVVRGNFDDVYYVNRSVWTAQHDTFSLRDTMFGPETHPSTYPFPFSSIEGLFGAMAGTLDVNAAVFSYFVGATFWCVLAAWALWRLASAWVPRAPLLVYWGAILLLLFNSGSAMGDYSFSRMWTGKVIGLSVMLPLAWVYFTRLANGRGSPRWALAMLFLCGLGFVGMSPTAVVMSPVISAVVVMAALLQRHHLRTQLLGAVAFSAAPVVTGAAVLFIQDAATGAAAEATPAPWEAFGRALGDDLWVVALLLLGLGVGARMVRPGGARALAAASVLVTVVIMLPGMPGLLDAATGSGPIYFRLLLVPPLSILGATILVLRPPGRVSQVGRIGWVGALGIVFVVILVAGGTSPWHNGRGHLVASPHADVTNMQSWENARHVAALGNGQRVLMPPPSMRSLAIYTTESFVVNPRDFYLHALQESESTTQQRRLLSSFIARDQPRLPHSSRVVQALSGLRVTTVCTTPGQERQRRITRRAGYGDPVATGSLLCQRKDPSD